MKRLFLVIPVFIVMLFQACSSLNSGEEKEGLYIGKVYDVFEGDTLFISGADIVVDGDILTQTDKGIFKLDLKSGKYNIKIETGEHEPKELEITVQGGRTTFSDMELIPVFAEYFPLADGYEWYYSYSGFETNDREDNEYKGTRKLLISEVSNEGDDILYSFEISDSTTSYLDYDSWDEENEKVIRAQDTTTVLKSYTALVREKPNGQLIVESEVNPFFVLGSVFTSWDEEGHQMVTPLLRYLPFSRFTEEIEIMAGGTGVYPGHVTVEKGKGVVDAGEGGGHLDKYSYGYTLQSINFEQ